MDSLSSWHQSVLTTLGLFWTAFWAFGFGYLISSMIQIFVTRERMRKSMGDAGPTSVLLGSFFGFISSSCSFAALSTTRSLFTKGAGLVPALAFLLASTNLVIELGFIIGIFLGWQFVVGEYAGGILLILFMWILVRLTARQKWVDAARENARDQEEQSDEQEVPDWKDQITSLAGWRDVAIRYVMEWKMVWKDVTIGFTVAGIIATFVPKSFFQALFIGSGNGDPEFWQVLAQSIIGPVAAFFTFIGSMGNIPLAAVLYGNGVSFAGIMAFMFSDLVVLPVLRIQAKYYGWKMTFYIAAVFLVALVAASLVLHYGFAFAGALPDGSKVTAMGDRDFFAIDYTFFFNLAFIALSVGMLIWKWRDEGFDTSISDKLSERILFGLAIISIAWLLVGLVIPDLGF